MDYLVTKIKTEINEKIGFTIDRQADVKYLHEKMTISVLKPISFNTLRRFYGFLPSSAPQFKTLDTISEYLGYKSFSEFSDYVNKDQDWDRYTFISDFENTDKITPKMLERLIGLKYHNDYVYYISVIIKSFIRRERLDLLKIIFIRRSPSFLFKKNDLSSVEVLEVLKIAYAVGGALRSLSKIQYQKLVPLLHDKYEFKSNILDFYIDYSNFNGYYGFLTKRRLLFDTKEGDLLFVNLILKYKLFLSGNSLLKEYKPNISIPKLYPALIGRLLAYELLVTHFTKGKPINNFITKIASTAKNYNISVFFIEIFPALIFVKAIDQIEYLFSLFTDQLFEANNWRYYATQNTYLISLSLLEISKENYKKAEYHLNLVSLDDSKTNSYYAYLKLFNLIAEYQLELKTTAYRLVLKNIEAEYLELVKLTGFKRFTLRFLKKYF